VTPAPGGRRLAVLVFFAMLISQGLLAGAGIVAPVLATLAAPEIGLDAYLVGIYVSILYAAAASTGLVSGSLIERWGSIRVCQLCLLLSAAALALATLGYASCLVVAALVLGVGYGPATPASSHVLIKVTPPERLNIVFSLRQTGVPLGNLLAGATLPSLALVWGWRAAVLSVALVCLVTAAAMQPLHAEVDRDARGAAAWFPPLSRLFSPLVTVLRSTNIRLLALTSFAYAGMQTCFSTFVVTYLVEGLGMDVVRAGFILGAGQAAGVVGRVVWGALADRLGRPALVLGGLGLAMAAAAILMALFTPSWPYVAVVAVCIIYGGTAIAWNGVHLAQLARLAGPGRAGEVTGGTFFITFGGVTLTPLFFSLMLATTGSYAAAFAGVSLMGVASGIAFLTRRL
jgi:MFS family permease